jgi:hypothetical protein
MSKSNIAIALIWLYFIGDALMQGIGMPKSKLVELFPAQQAASIILIFPFVFFLFAAFFQRKRDFKPTMFIGYFDKKYGQGASEIFINKLRPITLFMVAAFTLGLSGLLSTYLTTKAMSPYIMSGFFLSAGLGLLSAYLLSIRFPPRLN